MERYGFCEHRCSPLSEGLRNRLTPVEAGLEARGVAHDQCVHDTFEVEGFLFRDARGSQPFAHGSDITAPSPPSWCG